MWARPWNRFACTTASTLETVFAGLKKTDGADCPQCLQSVWTWNVPQTRIDYIIDPGEGLWDEPGWKRYFPEDSVDENGVSRAFLTDLLSLHANTAYLVQVSEPTRLAVPGVPQVRKHRWVQDSYNLAGFPIDPDAPPTVGNLLSESCFRGISGRASD